MKDLVIDSIAFSGRNGKRAAVRDRPAAFAFVHRNEIDLGGFFSSIWTDFTPKVGIDFRLNFVPVTVTPPGTYAVIWRRNETYRPQ